MDISNKAVIEKLRNWKIIKRLDATDNKKHMGLLLLAPTKFLGIKDIIFSLDYVEGYTKGNKKKNKILLYQGIVLDLKRIYKKIYWGFELKSHFCRSKRKTVKTMWT